MAGWIVWNVSEHRQEVQSLFPSKEDAEAAIERLRGSDPSYFGDGETNELVVAQVEK